MEFWTVPNTAGLPTVDAAAVVADGGINPHTGKGALISLIPGTTVLNTGPFIKLDWVGATVEYDDLGFFDDSVGFIIPDVNPPITRVRMWTQVVWPPNLTAGGTRGMFHGFVGGNVPFRGGGFDQLPEATTANHNYRNVLVSAPFEFGTVPFVGLPLNCFVGQTSAGTLIISVQEMAIEVVR